MTRGTFLTCVAPHPDEYEVAKTYGVPEKIEQRVATDDDQSAYQWVYTDKKGTVKRFAFTWDGRLLWQSTYEPKSR